MKHPGRCLPPLVLIVLFNLASFCSFSQIIYKQSVKGYITDGASGKPLPDVTITFNPGHIAVISDSTGYFKAKDLPLGRYTIEFSCIGYEERTLTDILVTSGKENEQNITLTERITN